MNEKMEPKKHLEEWEESKKAVRCPCPREARTDLFLTVKQFCELLEISEGDYWDMEAGSKRLSHSQKIFLVEALRIAREKGIIGKRFED